MEIAGDLRACVFEKDRHFDRPAFGRRERVEGGDDGPEVIL